MSTLLEIEAATEALPHEQKEELFRFLAVRLRPAEVSSSGASGALLVNGPNGTLLLEAPPGAPPMTTQMVRQLLEDFP
jgi:hypothetical protein